MFWQSKKTTTETPPPRNVTFEEAKEATRRAAFLTVAQGMTDDNDYRKELAELFHTCRSIALAAGAAQGYSAAEIDKEIAALCDADTLRFKSASDENFRDYVHESGAIVKDFLLAI